MGNREWGAGTRDWGLGTGDFSLRDWGVLVGYSNTTNYVSPVPIIPLQWFSDDAETEGRTEQPTEHKLRRLREEGQMPKSQELVGAVTLFLPALMLLFLAPSMLRTCVEMFRFFFLRAVELDPTKDAIIAGIFFRYLARMAVPILAVAVFAALFSNIVQVGIMFSTKPITPDFTKVLPRFGQFFSRIFSVDGLFNLGKSIVKMLIIGGVAFFLIRMEIEKLANLQKAGLWLGLTTVASIAIRMLLICALLLLILSIPDLLFQRWRFRERNKMSRQEMKEEMKMYEGDPQVRNRIRSRFRDLLKQNIAAAVPRADVVITNPTHYAVALEYQKDSMPGPMVTAKGADEAAARIRKLAQDNGVPLVENKPVAQALYREVEVGDYVPETYYSGVATIFRKVMDINELRRKAKSSERASA
ncbi:MAG: flagellar biosynthesis protein FlhB [Treponema sp.]|nr:flagellar biosynthesis protein FlhB [Treponema sp.]